MTNWHISFILAPVPTEAPTGISVDLVDDGLLWMFNKIVLHPLGFALGIDSDGEAVLFGNGTRKWAYVLGEGEEQRLFERFHAALGEARANNPQETVGVKVLSPPEDCVHDLPMIKVEGKRVCPACETVIHSAVSSG